MQPKNLSIAAGVPLLDTYLGQYRLLELIRRSHTTVVYKAYQPRLDRYVALKVVAPTSDAHFVARFQREAWSLAVLQHPNIVPIYDYGEQDGLLYLVLQYVEHGTTLEALMLGQPWDLGSALRLMTQVLAALSYAHSHDVIHRDIKPTNILLPTPTWPLLADWGIARLVHARQALTSPGQAVGTALYMAPERALGQPGDARSDLYAVGVLLYEMLCGRVPFDGDTPLGVLWQHIAALPPLPRSINPALPPRVEAMLLRALAKNPDHRYQTADAMVQAMEELGLHRAPPQPVRGAVPVSAPIERHAFGSALPGAAGGVDPDVPPAPPSQPIALHRGRGNVLGSVRRGVGSSGSRRRVGEFVGVGLLLVMSVLVSATLIAQVAPKQPAHVAQPLAQASPRMQPYTSTPSGTANATTVAQATTEGMLRTRVAPAPFAATLAVPTLPVQPAASAPSETPTVVPEQPTTTVPVVHVLPSPTVVFPTQQRPTALPTLLPPTLLPRATNRPPPTAPPRPTAPLRPTTVPARPTTVPATAVPPTLRPTTVPPTAMPPTFTPQPTNPPVVAQPTPTAGQTGGRHVVSLADHVWTGGYHNVDPYHGHHGVWIFGKTTDTSVIETTFEVGAQPIGVVQFGIQGMDGGDGGKALIRINVNGEAVYQGPNPLPDDDPMIPAGTWATYRWSIDAANFKPGQNTISIMNLSDGQADQPPYLVLDYAFLIIRS